MILCLLTLKNHSKSNCAIKITIFILKFSSFSLVSKNIIFIILSHCFYLVFIVLLVPLPPSFSPILLPFLFSPISVVANRAPLLTWIELCWRKLHERVTLAGIVRDHYQSLQSLKAQPKSFRGEKIPPGITMEETAEDGSTRLPLVKASGFSRRSDKQQMIKIRTCSGWVLDNT